MQVVAVVLAINVHQLACSLMQCYWIIWITGQHQRTEVNITFHWTHFFNNMPLILRFSTNMHQETAPSGKLNHLPASFSSSSWGVDLRLLDRLPEGLMLLENHWLKRLADTGPSPKTSSIICETQTGATETERETQNTADRTVQGQKVALTFRAFSIDLAQKVLEDWVQ